MAAVTPNTDGEVNVYDLANHQKAEPRIYFVNGIRVLPKEHAQTAGYLSLLIEHPVWGVYNETAGKILGFVVDGGQSILDYVQNATASPWSRQNQTKPRRIPEADIPTFLSELERRYFVWNKATLSLFRQLIENRHQMQMIIAHSQGNLITSNALFIMEDILGSAALQKVRVYSLASPSPAWPLGLRWTNGGGGRQDNAFMNDMVALLRPHNLVAKFGYKGIQNAGDFRTHPGAGPVAVAVPHDTNEIISTLNFLKSIRKDLGLSTDFTREFLEQASARAHAAFP